MLNDLTYIYYVYSKLHGVYARAYVASVYASYSLPESML